jgi:branched-chain amino acid transport system permease protein
MSAYLANMMVLLGIAVILASSLNLMVGYAGIFSVAHAVFYGVGAYTAAKIALGYTDSFLLATAAAMLVSGAVSFILAVPVLRVREEYFVVASIGFQIVASTVFVSWGAVTGGMGGLAGIPPARLLGWQLGSPVDYMLLTGLCVVAVLAVIALLVHSPFGRALKAFRDDEVAAVALGKDPLVLRVTATTISGALAAVAGSLYAFYISFVNPESFTLDYSVLVLAMVIIGGAGSLWGPIIGAVFITVFPAVLTFLAIPSQYVGPVQQLIYGVAIVVLMVFWPSGIASVWRLLSPTRARASTTRAAGPAAGER